MLFDLRLLLEQHSLPLSAVYSTPIAPTFSHAPRTQVPLAAWSQTAPPLCYEIAPNFILLMATQRVVAYLPLPDYEKLQAFMQERSLAESAALVKIVQQFFAATGEPSPESQAIASLQTEMALLQQRLSAVEQSLASGRQGKSYAAAHRSPSSLPELPPQTQAGLAKRLGVQLDSIVQALEKGEDYFTAWSKQRDPASKAWCQKGDRFYPVSQ